jgi:rhodanese-related sulfurtransferase
MRNYSLKNIMLGIGIGLVISSMVNLSAGSKELTAEEIKNEAAKHNLIVLTKEEILNSQAPTIAPAVEPENNVPAPTPSKADQPKKVTVIIEGGMTSEAIADLLKENGLISDTEANGWKTGGPS